MSLLDALGIPAPAPTPDWMSILATTGLTPGGGGASAASAPSAPQQATMPQAQGGMTATQPAQPPMAATDPAAASQPQNPYAQLAAQAASYKPSYWETVQNRQQGMSWADAQEAARQHYYMNLQRQLGPAQFAYARNFVQQTVPDNDPNKAAMLADPLNAFQSIQKGIGSLYSTPTAMKPDERQVVGGRIVNAPTGTYSVDANGNVINSSYGLAPQTGQLVMKRAPGEGIDVIPGSNGPGAAPQGAGAASAPVVGGPQVPAGPATVLTPRSAPTDVAATIRAKALAAGLSPDDATNLTAIGQLESGLNPRVRNNGSSTGLFQFHPSTFAATGGQNISDPNQQIDAAINLYKANQTGLQAAGLPVNPTTLYLAHQQGLPGTKALLGSDPATNAVDALTPLYQAQYGAIRGASMARQAITGNGGTADESVGDFLKGWGQRVQAKIAQTPDLGAMGAGAVVAPQPGNTPFMSNSTGLQEVVAPTPNRPIDPQTARAQGLAPGRWFMDPTGKPILASPAPKDDVNRIDSLTATASTLQDLVNEQQAFMRHNQKAGTGLPYVDPQVHGVGINPLLAINERNDPDVKAMTASEGKQIFLVKPSNAGARILQSELPFWQSQTQNVSNDPTVNAGILRDNQAKLAQAQQRAEFYQNWIYSRGNLDGADQAWAQAQRQPAVQQAPVPARPMPGQRLSPQEAQALPPGATFIGLDGVPRVRH